MRLTHLTLKNWRNFKQADFDLQERVFVIGDDQHLSRWSYQVTFTAEQRGRHRPILRSEVVERNGETVLSRPTDEDTDDPERMTQTHLEQVNANRGFREIVDYLGSIRYLHLVPQLIREPDRGRDRSDDPYGADFLLRIAKTPERTRTRRLHRIGQSLKAAVPQLDQLDLVQDEIGHWHLQARYEHWRHTPARQTEQDFSDGTLRLIGLLWSLLEGKKDAGPVLLEEPELSLHNSVVRQLPTILSRVRSSGGPQVLLTTHATDVLEDPGLGKDEVVLLTPAAEGTEADAAGSIPDIQELLDAGMSLADILAPRTAPPEVQDLPGRLAPA